jgi:cyanophycinase
VAERGRSAGAARRRRGRLILIGGNEDMDERDMRILPTLVRHAGGAEARLLVCAAASSDPEPTLEAYTRVFRKLGVAEVHRSALNDREEANGAELADTLDRCTGVFFTGGDQLRITSLVAGTRFGEAVKQRYQREGLLVAGTSAGAAAASSTMIIRGIGDTVRRDAVELAPGLGFVRDIVVDTHFDRGGRVHRLMTVFAQNPAMMGIGIDEDTALDLAPTGKFTVLGRGVVMVFDGHVTHTNAAEVRGNEAIALTDVKVQVLAAGYAFDLRARAPIVPKSPRASAA